MVTKPLRFQQLSSAEKEGLYINPAGEVCSNGNLTKAYNGIVMDRCAELQFPIQKIQFAHKVYESGSPKLLLIGYNKKQDKIITAKLSLPDWRVTKQLDNKTYSDITAFSYAELNSRKKFTQENDLGKARVLYQFIDFFN